MVATRPLIKGGWERRPWAGGYVSEDEDEVETAVESIVLAKAEDDLNSDDGQIVVIRPHVVENVGHVLGNMFQRIYHLVQRTREGDVAMAVDLDGNIRRLEGFLQLVMDYVSPLSLSMQDVSLGDVVQSLAQQVGDAVGHRVTIEGEVPADGRLLADAGRLARAFGLLCLRLRPQTGCEEAIRIKAAARTDARSLALVIMIPRGCISEPSSESEMQWAVAEKLLEIHGGVLQQSPTVSGGVLWEIMLPPQC